MKKIFREKGNLNRPTAQKKCKFNMQYGSPTLFRKVELNLVFSNVVKGLLKVLDFLWIETVNPDREWSQHITGR